MQLKFGKYKGQTLEERVASDEGRSYLEWLRDNTETTGKYAKQNKELIGKIITVLADASGPVVRNQTIAPQAGSISVQILTNILNTLKSIERLLAKTPQEAGPTPDEDLPF